MSGGSWSAAARLFAAVVACACEGAPDVVARETVAEPPIDPSQPPQMLALSGDLDVHDPGIVEASGRFFVFHTGDGIATKLSDDLVTWRSGPRVFDTNPPWIEALMIGATNLWSPDVTFFGGRYHLYYAASMFGSDRSCIGHATAARLDPSVSFTDQGPVVCSNTTATEDDWNAIDPDVVLDEEGAPWLIFGSFRAGIQLIALDESGARAGDAMQALAARAEGEPIQAAILIRRGAEYYLFASFDLCCAGVDSTRYVVVGRSSSLHGPYVDRDGRPLLEGGGTVVLEGDARWRGPGSNSVLFRGARAYNVFHAYDVNGGGLPTLRIAELVFDAEGWPVSAGP